jgi:hypothetical protein
MKNRYYSSPREVVRRFFEGVACGIIYLTGLGSIFIMWALLP